jgi:type III secretion protein C
VISVVEWVVKQRSDSAATSSVMPKIRHWAFTWLIIFSACTLGLSVHAVTPDTWKDTTYSYRESASESALLGDVLYAFAKSMGLKVKVAPNVAIRQKAMIDSASATPTVFMDKLASMHGLSWFVHDGVLNVANANEFKIEKIPLGNFSPAVAKQALQGLGC